MDLEGTRFGTIFDRFSGGPGPKSPRKCDFSPTDNSVNNDKYEKYPSRTHAGTSGNEIAHGPAHAKLTTQSENIDFLHADFGLFFKCDTVVHFEGSDGVENSGISIFPRENARDHFPRKSQNRRFVSHRFIYTKRYF